MKVLINTSKIFVAMAESGFNGAELARKSGVSSSAVSNVLNGNRCGSTKVLGAICKTLDLPVKDVVTVEE